MALFSLGRVVATPGALSARVELIYIAALFGDEELRAQLSLIGFEDVSLEDAETLRTDLLVEFEKMRRELEEG
jgi:hypothetical protein